MPLPQLMVCGDIVKYGFTISAHDVYNSRGQVSMFSLAASEIHRIMPTLPKAGFKKRWAMPTAENISSRTDRFKSEINVVVEFQRENDPVYMERLQENMRRRWAAFNRRIG